MKAIVRLFSYFGSISGATRLIAFFVILATLLGATPALAQRSCTWTGAFGDGNWFAPLNWDCGGGSPGPPAPIDSAFVDLTPFQQPRINGANALVASVNVNFPATLLIDAGFSLTVTASYQQGGNLIGDGDLILAAGAPSATGVWTGNTMQGSGAVVVQNGGQLFIGPGIPKFLITRTIDVQNGGQVFVDDGFSMDGNAVINIGPGAAFALRTDTAIVDGIAPGGGTIGNAGTVVKTFGSGTTTIAVPYNSTNITQANIGRLAFSGGGSFTGGNPAIAYLIPNGGDIVLQGGTFTYAVTFAGGPNFIVIDGATVDVNNTTGTLNGDSVFENLKLLSGAITGTQAATIFRTFIWSGGSMTGSGVTRLNGSFPYCCASPSSTWNGGTKTINDRLFSLNNGSTFWNAGDIALQNTGRLQNFSFLGANGNTTVLDDGTGLIENLSTFTINGGSSVTFTPGTSINNVGGIDSSGTLTLNGTYVHLGGAALGVANGGTIIAGNPLNFSSGSLRGEGSIIGDVVMSGGVTDLSAGPAAALDITGDYTLSPSAELRVNIDGVSQGTCTAADVLNVSGNVSLAGTLRTTRLSGCVPDTPNSFTVLQGGNVSGAFSQTVTRGFVPTVNTGPGGSVVLQGVAPFRDLVVSIDDSPDPASVGNGLVLTINFSSEGTLAATNGTVTIDLPANVDFTFVSPFMASCPPPPYGTQVVCTTDSPLPEGVPGYIQLFGTPNAAGTVTTTATISATEPDDIPANNTDSETTTIIGPQAFNVNTESDLVDLTPGDGVCDAGGGQCSLRAAIQESNALPTRDSISVPAGLYVISIAGDDDSAAVGDLDVQDGVDITGAGAATTIIDGNQIDRVFDVVGCCSQIVVFDGLTIRNGQPSIPGQDGGGLRIQDGAQVSILNSEIADNQATSGGGVGFQLNEGLRRTDRLLREQFATASSAAGTQLTNVAIIGNVADNNGGGLSTAFGSVALKNVTIGQNSAASAGGGIAIPDFTLGISLENATVAQNSATTGGGIYSANSSNANLYNTIVAGNVGGDCRSVGGSFTSNGYNIDGDGGCNLINIGDQPGTDPKLQPLTNAGSQTRYFPLGLGSPAIDGGDPGSTLTFDQRNSVRPIDGDGDSNPVIDIGSIEVAAPPSLAFTVNTTADAVDILPGDGVCATAASQCSLRAAIQEANAYPAFDTINVPAGTYNLTIPGTDEDFAATGDLDVSDGVNILGARADTTIISAQGLDRVFDLQREEVTIAGLTIRDGVAPAGSLGGGIQNNSYLTLLNAEVTNNSADSGGGIHMAQNFTEAKTAPTKLRLETHAVGIQQIINTTIANNTTTTGGGGGLHFSDYQPGMLRNVTFSGNSAPAGTGGGILADGALLTVVNVTVSQNTALSGSGIYAFSSANANFSHSIIAGNPGGNCAGGTFGISSGYNLDDDGSCDFTDPTDQPNTNPMLGAFGNYSFSMRHYPLLPGSPAIDAAPTPCPSSTDQLGRLRPIDGDANGIPLCDLGSIEATFPPMDLTITKTGPATVTAGTNITYTITVGNNGPATSGNAIVNDSPSGSLTFVSNTGDCTVPFPCNLGPIANGVTKTITSTFAVASTAPATVNNTATVLAAYPSPVDSNTANNIGSATTTVNSTADLSVFKGGSSFITAGQMVTYITTVSNSGPSNAANTIVSDPTPAGLTFVSNSGACSTPFPCNIGTVASGGNQTITSVYQVSPGATGTITNTASATSDVTDPNTADNSGSVTSAIIASGDLSIVKNGPASVVAGQTITYTIDVINPGPSNATGVMVADPTPAGTTFVSNTGACATAFPCNLGTLTPGQTASITANFSVSSTATGSVTNTATVSSTAGDSNTTNNSSSSTATVVSQSDVSITKTGPATADNGDTVVYTVTVSNSGPSPASNVMIDDPTPAGLTFVSNSGACTTPYPCGGGTLAAGQTKTITSTYTVSSGASGSITNTASVSTTTGETSTSNNSSSTTVTVAGCPQAAPSTSFPADGMQNAPLNGSLLWTNTGAASYNVYFGPAAVGCSTLIFSGSATSQEYFNLEAGQEYEFRVEGLSPGCSTLSSACARFRAASSVNCPDPPTMISPTSGTVTSPVPFVWSEVANATSYTLFINGQDSGTTPGTTLTRDIDNGQLTWFVIATVPGCGPLQSQGATLNICNIPSAPLPSVVGEAATGQSYRVQWTDVPNAIRYELQESLDAEFDSVNDTFVVTGNFRDFEKNIDNPPVGFYYRVRAIGVCGELPGPYSEIVRIVIVPIPANPNVSIPAGSIEVVLQTIFVPGDPGITSQFTATTDQLWLSVRPSSGLLPPDGITLNIVADPSTLSNGTFTGTVILELTDVTTLRTAGKLSPDQATGGKKKQIPVSISLVTPVTPQQRTTPVNDSLIIPSVGHLDGINSRFQSDVRVTNTSLNKLRYQISFNQAGQDPGRPIKQTFVDVEGNGTIALDDIVKNFFGIGGLGDQAAGFIEIRPFGSAGALSPEVDQAGIPRASRVTVASSRTYNIGSNGTLGQFIPALSFSGFISKLGGAFAQTLSLQQIAQNTAFRSNIGLVEASGLPVSVLMSIFDTAGNKLLELPVDLKGGELRQFNALLAQNGITLADGRVEARVLSGDGRVTAYASVIENATNDPLLVSGVALGQTRARRFVFPGAGALTSAAARFRTDMRIFNSGAPQVANLTFYPQGGESVSRSVMLNSGEVRLLDDVVATLFGVQGAGAVHVETPTDAELIVTGRTYADTARGRFGQFIEAVTSDEAVGRTERALNILQVEDSPRYRTNIGVAEVTGKPATVEVLVFLPDSKVVPRVTIPMKANEFRQFQLLKELGLGNVYNARVTVRVTDGEGRVTAYGSVVDETSQDPTYIKAQ